MLNIIKMQINTAQLQEHLKAFRSTFLTLLAITVVLLQLLYTKTAQWYRSGGKEELIQLSYQSREIVVSFYHWLMDEFVPGIIWMYQGIRYNLVLFGLILPAKARFNEAF